MTTLNELLLESNPDASIEQSEVMEISSAESATYNVADSTRVVQLGFDSEDVAGLKRSGDTLIITLENGQVIRLDGYFSDARKAFLDFDEGLGFADLGAGGISGVGQLAGVGALGLAALAVGGGDDGGIPAPSVIIGAARADGLVSVSGRGRPNASVTVTMPNGEELTVMADAMGDYAVTSTTVQPDGPVSAVQTDAEGNGPSGSNSADYEVDVTPPAEPGINELVTGVDTVIAGTGEPGATVRVTDADNNLIGNATVDADGNWSVVPASPLAEGAEVRATQTDTVGNVGDTAARNIMIDTDGDGTADATDNDDDNDGIADADETGLATRAFSVIEEIPGNPDGMRLSTEDGLFSMDIFYGANSTETNAPGFNTSNGTIGASNSTSDSTFIELVFDTSNSPTPFSFDTISLNDVDSLSAFSDVRDTYIWSEPGEWTETSTVATIALDPNAPDGIGMFTNVDPNSPTADESVLGTLSHILAHDSTTSDALFNVSGSANNHSVTHVFDQQVEQASLYITNPNGGTMTWSFNVSTLGVEVDGPLDTDEDGIVDARDFDSDGDKIWDIFEGTSDADADGEIAARDTDSNDDGTSDTADVALDAADLAALADGASNSDGYLILENTAGLNFDLGQFDNVSNLEYIDIEGTNSQSVTITAQDVLDTSASDQLYVFGNGNDQVNADGFAKTGERAFQGEVVDVYTSGSATLLIEQDVNVVI